MNQPSVLIVDDEPYMLELIETVVRDSCSRRTRAVSDPLEVAYLLDREVYDLVFLDLRMPGLDGLEVLGRIKRDHPQTEVVIITAYATVDNAVEALKLGAADLLTKPFDNQQLAAVLQRVLAWQEVKRENLALKRALAERFNLEQMIGSGRRMREIAAQAATLAQTTAPVYLQGEFGTGRSFFASAIHYAGPRAGGPLLSLDCASLADEEMERLLFGADQDSAEAPEGLLVQARGGTLHLHDPQRLPAQAQSRLADLLESGRLRPGGSPHLQSADLRLITSGERGLEEMEAQGSLEPRLAGLLARFPLGLPPLRARREDIPLFAGRFLEKYSKLYSKKIDRFSDRALKWLLAQDWPGNLRELENTIERTVLLSGRPVLEPEDLAPADYLSAVIFSLDPSVLDLPLDRALSEASGQFQRGFEERYLGHHLARQRGDLAATAAHVGLSPEDLSRRLARLDLRPDLYKTTG
jgi:DNA-binding NtrC family response regulator